MKKKMTVFICSLLILSIVAGCSLKGGSDSGGTSQNPIELVEVNQNDYRGAIMRTLAIKDNILGIVNDFNERNQTIITENPSSYWDSEAYKYLALNFINDEIIMQTVFLNETETDWDTVVDITMGVYKDEEGNLTVRDYLLTREAEGKYTLSYTKEGVYYWYKNRSASFQNTITALYDANHDWAKAERKRKEAFGSSPLVSDGLYEYARLGNNAFAIQTETERLYVVYEDDLYSEANNPDELTNPLKDKKIKQFAYSKLNGEILPKYCVLGWDENTEKYFFQFGTVQDGSNTNDVDYEGNYGRQYNPSDTLFSNIDSVGKDWVLEQNGMFSQILLYEDGNLTVQTLNELSHKMEYTVFHADGQTENGELEIKTVEEILLEQYNPEGGESGTEGEEGGEEQQVPPLAFNYDDPKSSLHTLKPVVSTERTEEREVLQAGLFKGLFSVDNKDCKPSDVGEKLGNALKISDTVTTDIDKIGTLTTIEEDEIIIMILAKEMAQRQVYDKNIDLAILGMRIGGDRSELDKKLGVTSTSQNVTYISPDNEYLYVDYDEEGKIVSIACLI